MAALACLGACSGDLTPPQALLETRVSIVGPTRQVLNFDAAADAPVRVTVASRGVDVRVAVGGEANGIADFADAPNRRLGVETLLIEAGHQPVITVTIESNDHAGARGSAQVTAVALPLRTESDRQRLEAARLEAKACLDFPEIARGVASAEAFARAAEVHARNGERRHEGLARLHEAGARYARLSDWAGAAEFAAVAEPLLARSDAPDYAAFAARVEGAALDQLANSSGVAAAERTRILKRARERLTEAAERFQALGNDYEAGYALNYRGVSYHVAGDQELARGDYLRALGLFRTAHDEPAQALSLQSLALQSYEDGRLRDAMREFDEALDLIPREKEPESYAHALHNSAWPLRAVGRFDEAISRFYLAGEALRELGDRNGEARALHGLGSTLMVAGEPDRAIELLSAAIRLRGQAGSRREQAVSLLALAELEQQTGQVDNAISHLERAQTLVSAPVEIAKARLFLARAYIAASRLVEARQKLNDIALLEIPATNRFLGLALAEMGELDSRAGHAESAHEHFSNALKILMANGADLEYARTLGRRAEASLKDQDFRSALDDSRSAIQQLELIGLNSLQAESRAAFRASYRDAVEIQIEASLAQADNLIEAGTISDSVSLVRSALAASDRAHAQLLEGSTSRQEFSVPAGLLVQREQLYEQLPGKRQRRDRLLSATQPDETTIASLTREIALLRTKASLVESKIAAVQQIGTTNIDALDVTELDVLLPDGLVIAEFFIGRRHAWLFEVRRGQVKAHVLGSGTDLSQRARELNAMWSAPGPRSSNRTAMGRQLASRLFGELQPLSASDTLYIIPDGALHLVPTTVLAREFIAVSQANSVHAALALAPLVHVGTSGDRHADRALAVIADPVYSVDDPRIGVATVPTMALADDILVTRHARNLARLKRLPSTLAEAKVISGLAPKGSASLELVGVEATRQNVLKGQLGRYRYIHFATHAIADTEDPALATLALSRFDRSGKAIEGDLRSFEIARLDLNADLVVLSACDTAVGREIAGEAPLSLAQSFLRSGAGSVVATLWRVPDVSTARFMEEFYRQLLVRQQPPATALELAQNFIRGHPRWSDPYYWAGFQLTSNARFSAGNKNVNGRGG